MLLTEGFLGWLSRFKLIRLRRISLATFADGWAEGWAEGWIGGGMDTYIYIACLRQVVAFAPKVIIIACLRQGFCIRKTR